MEKLFTERYKIKNKIDYNIVTKFLYNLYKNMINSGKANILYDKKNKIVIFNYLALKSFDDLQKEYVNPEKI